MRLQPKNHLNGDVLAPFQAELPSLCQDAESPRLAVSSESVILPVQSAIGEQLEEPSLFLETHLPRPKEACGQENRLDLVSFGKRIWVVLLDRRMKLVLGGAVSRWLKLEVRLGEICRLISG